MIAPAPWHLAGSGSIVLYRFPRAWALEHGQIPERLRGAFLGGVGAVMLVDYRASPVGPYREALFIPGQFRLAGRVASSITRIYVSTWPSVEGGRQNWGLPKELADITIESSNFTVEVAGNPILAAGVEPVGPYVPLHTGWLPVPTLIGQERAGTLYLTRLSGRGAVRLAHLRHVSAYAPAFPDLAPFRPLVALHVAHFTLTFPVPEVRAG